ncbi:hypothetical protein QGN23_02185 [Chryseobacterium gotjawalense]|uniref:Carboxypeptidase regulatory-like domain-containing protein n=1 Tax=Chryseobacterium gotjawalense TaxID=3042315 RepID=A0ABY8RE04_9FLAO|nr:hypothetical protein [Chryseobacterium sp. wdc7]WHF52096.1 hypothetical protein QGN23_02185 [Chryseobacterium sp. wdc7]
MRNTIILFSILIISLIFLSNCRGDGDKQNLDIHVSGKVSNDKGVGISNVKIYFQRGKWGNYAPPIYTTFETVTTDNNGNYQYTIKNDSYVYKICCELPSGYNSVTPRCKDIDYSVIHSHTIPNVINFTLTN